MLTEGKFIHQLKPSSHEGSFAKEGRKKCHQKEGDIKRYIEDEREEETKKVDVEKTYFQGNQEESCNKSVENKKSKERDKISPCRARGSDRIAR